MKNQILTIPISELEIHPDVKEKHSPINLDKIEYTMKMFGQQQPITIIVSNKKNYIVDGVLRFMAAQNCGIEKMDCIVKDLADDEIMDFRIRSNQKAKISFLETCHNVEHILNLLGNSQGKKRELMGFEDFESEDNFGSIGKDRFELACIILNLKMSPSTLRKLMAVYWSEKDLPEENKTGVIDLLEKDEVSIHKAFSLIKKKEKKLKEKEERRIRDCLRSIENTSYRLYNKSSMYMDEIKDGSIHISVFSGPYYTLKDYRYQGEEPYGQEKTVEEYINKTKLFIRELLKKLTPNGVAVCIIGETYKNGYQGICRKYEAAIEEVGGKILDVDIWEKTNPLRHPHNKHFQPAKESIIIFTKQGADPIFLEQYIKSKTVEEGSKAKYGRKREDGTKNVYLHHDETPITNVFRTPVFNKAEWEGVDPNFKHDAPAPLAVYDRYLKSYSEPGMTFLDIFCGSGQGLISGMRHGLNVIGYDIDPESIEFCQKRIDHELEKTNKPEIKLVA